MSMPHLPSDKSIAQVAALSSFGIPQVKIAKYLGISEPTLTKYYREELDTALIDKTVMVANALYNNAVENNNVTAQIFFLKTRAGWREVDREETEHKPDIGKIQIEVINSKGEVKT